MFLDAVKGKPGAEDVHSRGKCGGHGYGTEAGACHVHMGMLNNATACLKMMSSPCAVCWGSDCVAGVTWFKVCLLFF